MQLIRSLFFTDPSKICDFYVIGYNRRDVYEVTENRSITFNCSIDSSPESKIVINFTEFDEELRSNVSTQILIHELMVKSCLDAGKYTCMAQNGLNSQPSFKELTLKVRCKYCGFPFVNV